MMGCYATCLIVILNNESMTSLIRFKWGERGLDFKDKKII